MASRSSSSSVAQAVSPTSRRSARAAPTTTIDLGAVAMPWVPLLAAGAGDLDIEQAPQRVAGHPQGPAEADDGQPMETAGLAPLAGQLIGGAPADAQHAGGLLDGQHVGQVIETLVRRRPREAPHAGTSDRNYALVIPSSTCRLRVVGPIDTGRYRTTRTRTRYAQTDPPKPHTEDPYLGLTPNQVVAYNLALAREWKGWTQDEAAAALEPYLGKRWSKASVSQAERSVAGKFIRNFDADELVAFARAFELPVGWFLMPPPPGHDEPGRPVKLATPDAERFGTALAELVDLVFGDEHGQAILTQRLDGFLEQLGSGPLTEPQARIRALVQHKVATLARSSLRELEDWQTALRSLANHIEDLEARARRAVADDLGTDQL